MPEEPPAFEFPLEEVTEGTTRLWVPRSGHVKGPKKKEGVPFYNPAMRTARDVSVLVLGALTRARGGPLRIVDAMAATGARGLRLAHEVPGTKVQLNDANPECVQLAQHNARRLGLRTIDFRVGRLETHLAAESYDWVDLDPYGTPAPFLDVAMLSVEEDGIVAVTATDKATLSGVYPVACQRRYNAKPLRGPCMPETAVRILAGAVVRAAGRRDRAARPLLAYAHQHYVRCYARISGGAKDADEAAASIGYAVFRPDGVRGIRREPEPGAKWAGPLWGGPLLDPALLGEIATAADAAEGIAAATKKTILRWQDELAAPPLYYEMDDFTRGTRLEAPRIERWIEALRDSGEVAARTHFSPRGIKTTAAPQRMRSCLESAASAAA